MKPTIFLVLFSIYIHVNAQVLDPTFGTAGQTTIARFSPGADLEVQPDGKILTIGSMDSVTVINGNYFNTNQSVAVSRFNTDGSLDTTFGLNGFSAVGVESILYPNYSIPWKSTGQDIHVQDDGKILLAGFIKGTPNLGTILGAFALRLNSDGTIDTTFGQNGAVKLNTVEDGIYEAYAIRQLSSGKIACGGKARGLGIMLLESNGMRDTTFGNNGVADSTGFLNIFNNIEFLIEDGSGIIGIGGRTDENYSLYRIKVNATGNIDTTYTNGPVPMQPGFSSIVTDAVIQADDSSVFVAGTVNKSGQKGIVYKLKSNGAVDSTFGTNGYYINIIESNFGGVFIDSDGKLLVPGILEESFDSINFSLHRITSTGQLDFTFGNGSGFYVSNLPAMGTSITQFATVASAIQVDGKIIIATNKGSLQNYLQYIARFFPSTIISVNETIITANFNLYPNPVEHSASIYLDMPVETNSIKIIDIVGNTISHTNNSSNLIAPNKPGLYIIQVATNSGVFSHKLLVN